VWTKLPLLIPGYNDSDDEIERMSKWIVTELGQDVRRISQHFIDYRLLNTGQPDDTVACRHIALAGVPCVHRQCARS
jgi:pyruvate-formate lyase-activating enzyme